MRWNCVRLLGICGGIMFQGLRPWAQRDDKRADLLDRVRDALNLVWLSVCLVRQQ
jgi:hypothetical protein